jgi:hypothetical protein
VLEALKLHKQFVFPLSFWIQRGTRGKLAIPRSVLDLFEALYLPYAYLETGDDHLGSLKATKDFLVFFSDQMRAPAPVPSLPGRVTEHFAVVAGSGSVLDIEVELRGPSTDLEADLRVDLSALGLEPVLLDHDGEGRYTGALRLPDAMHTGFYVLPVTRVGEKPAYMYGIRVSVLPSGDMPLFGEALSPTWQLDPKPKSRLRATPEVFEGRAALALEGSGSWSLDWWAVNPPGLFGYETLSFDFHAGTASVAAGRTPRLRLQMFPGNIIDLLPEVDLSSRQWQRLVIPLERFEADERLDLKGFGFIGNLEGAFYLSDVRLMRREPPVSTAVAEEQGDRRPQAFALQQNFPNPFNSSTVIRFDLPEDGEVELAVFNLAGQQVAALVEGVREAGNYTINWDGRDDRGQELASGMYLYRLRAGERRETKKLVLVR